MFTADYHSLNEPYILFTREQGSRFAKEVADDFNPLHNPDNKLFCIPGDLLFSIALTRYGLSRCMRFTFTGMVSAGTDILFPSGDGERIEITDREGRQYLIVERSGETLHDPDTIEKFARGYVAFSGHNFPDLLIPLMTERGVMINPARPIVIYDSMQIELADIAAVRNPLLEYTSGTLEVNGKKGDVRLEFRLMSDAQVIGRGIKYMSLRGLKPYDEEQVRLMVDGYNRDKAGYRYAESGPN